MTALLSKRTENVKRAVMCSNLGQLLVFSKVDYRGKSRRHHDLSETRKHGYKVFSKRGRKPGGLPQEAQPEKH